MEHAYSTRVQHERPDFRGLTTVRQAPARMSHKCQTCDARLPRNPRDARQEHQRDFQRRGHLTIEAVEAQQDCAGPKCGSQRGRARVRRYDVIAASLWGILHPASLLTAFLIAPIRSQLGVAFSAPSEHRQMFARCAVGATYRRPPQGY